MVGGGAQQHTCRCAGGMMVENITQAMADVAFVVARMTTIPGILVQFSSVAFAGTTTHTYARHLF